MNKSFALLFSIKPVKKLANGTVPVYLRITIDSTRAEIAVKRYVIPAKLNQLAQKVIGNSEEARSLNIFENFRATRITGKMYAPATVKRYGTALRHLKSFLKWKYDVEDYDIKAVDHAFITA